jgi:WD40 repeat protein
MPFAEEQQAFFFGRDRDAELIADNLIAYRLTLLYGPSGVGKSSVLAAAVVPRLRRMDGPGIDGGPAAIVVTARSWRDDPLNRIESATAEALVAAGLGDERIRVDPNRTLAEHLIAWATDSGAEFYVILDQFEELFLYHDDPDDRALIEIAEAIADKQVPAHFLLAVREDALASLDRFKGRIPNLFSNYYRLEHLDVEAGRRAIVGPLEAFNTQAAPPDRMMIEPELVDDVLHQTQAGKVLVGTSGEGQVASSGVGGIETAHLQLVMVRLWAAERADRSPTLRASTLEALGGADAIVRSNLDDAMGRLAAAEQDLAASVFRQLVTPSGTKIAHSLDDLADYADVSADELKPVLTRLAYDEEGGRVLRSVPAALDRPDAPRYEIYHDALAGAVLEWRSRHELEAQKDAALSRLINEQRARRRRYMRLGLILMLVGLLVASGVLLLRLRDDSQRNRADRLATEAANALTADPQEATRLALEAIDVARTESARATLRAAAASFTVERAFSGHGGAVLSAAMSADEKRVVTASDDGTARVWDAASGQVLATLDAGTRRVFGAQLSPTDDDLALTWDDGGVVRLWSVSDAAERTTLAAPQGAVRSAAFAPDGATVAAIGDDGDVHLWDVASGRPMALDHGQDVASALLFLPDGDSIVTGDGGGNVHVWSVSTGEELAQPISTRASEDDTFSYVTALAADETGEVVAVGNSYADLFVWRWQEQQRTENPRYRWDPALGTRAILDVEFAPGSQADVALVTEKAGFLWRTAESAIPIRLDGHVDWALDVAFAPSDGDFVVTGSRDGTALVFDALTGGRLAQLRGHHGEVNTVSVDHEGRILTASRDGTARLWERPETRLVGTHDEWVIGLAVNEEADIAASVGHDGVARVWDRPATEAASERWTERWTINEPSLPLELEAVAIHPGGRHVATAGSTGTVTVWELLDDGAYELRDEWQLTGSVTSLAFDASGEHLAAGTSAGALSVWSWESRDPVRSIASHPDMTFVAWSPTESVIATGGSDGAVRLWDSATLDPLQELSGHSDQVWSVMFSPDGRRIVSASSDLTARVWPLDDPDRAIVLRGHDVRLSAASFDRTGERVITADAAGRIGFWQAESGASLELGQVHGDSVNGIYVLADGRVLSVGDDRAVRLSGCQWCELTDDELADTLRARLQQVPAPAEREVAEDVSIVDVAPGDCLPELSEESIERVDPLPCEQPHASEVFAIFELPADPDAAYPDDVHAQADELCEAHLEEYTGTAADPAAFVVHSLVPLEASWFTDRQVICLLSDPNGPITGSARSAGT